MIEPLRKDDLPEIVETFCFPWTTPEAAKEKWERYFAEQEKKIRVVLLAKQKGRIIGYGSLLFKDIPEIHDVWISSQFRGQGYGRKIIEHLEQIALKKGCKQVGIGVGLYKDYGPAQKLYFQMGYKPDGRGATYKNQPVIPGNSYPVDDDLILWLTKELS